MMLKASVSVRNEVTETTTEACVTEVGLDWFAGFETDDEVRQGVQEGVLVADGGAGHPVVVHVGVLGVGDVDLAPAG
jgi:hypothetical protein